MLKMSHTLFVEDFRRAVNELLCDLKFFVIFIGGILIYKLIFERTSLQPLITFRKALLGAIMVMLVRYIYLSMKRGNVFVNGKPADAETIGESLLPLLPGRH
jgi:hypothetical protein